MKKVLLTCLFLACMAPAMFALTYNDNITAIFGSGNPDGGWTSDTNNNIQLALRAKNTTNGATPNILGTYYFTTSQAWNLEFSINSDANGLSGRNLTSISYLLSGPGIPGGFNPIALIADNSYGNNSTLNGQGVEDNSPGLHNIGQNSEHGGPAPLGTYVFTLTAFDGATPLASTTITVVVTDNIPDLPDSGTTVAMLGLGLVGIAGFSLRKRSAKV